MTARRWVGFSAWVGVNPGKRAGVVPLINSSGRRPGEIGMNLIGRMAR